MQIKQIDRATIRNIQSRLQQHLADLGKELGVTFNVGNARYNETAATIKVEVATFGKKGEVRDRAAADFEKYAGLFGLKPSWLGKTFDRFGVRYKIVGLRTKAHKFPVIVESNGKRYKMDDESVRIRMQEKKSA